MNDLTREYLKSKGWNQPQSEFAVKDGLRIEFDYFPHDISNKKECREFETLDELKEILKDKSFTNP